MMVNLPMIHQAWTQQFSQTGRDKPYEKSANCPNSPIYAVVLFDRCILRRKRLKNAIKPEDGDNHAKRAKHQVM